MANTVAEQPRRNAVALISLAVAVSSLNDNTWRNESTEDNRNLRVAAYEILLKPVNLSRLGSTCTSTGTLKRASRVSAGAVC